MKKVKKRKQFGGKGILRGNELKKGKDVPHQKRTENSRNRKTTREPEVKDSGNGEGKHPRRLRQAKGYGIYESVLYLCLKAFACITSGTLIRPAERLWP